MAAVNGQKVQHLQYYNNYCIRVAILYLVLLRIGNYAERLFDSMETKNARTYEVFILAHLKVTTGHRLDTGLTSAQSICHFVVLLLILNLAFFFL